MSLQALNSGVSAAQSLELKTSKPVQATPVKEESTKVNSNLGSDNLKTSGLSKNPAWEGIKLGAKDGLKTGLIAGPIAGAAGVALISTGISLISSGKVNPLLLGGKSLLVGAGVGLAAGAVLGPYYGARDYGSTGVAVGVAVDKAVKNGEDPAKAAKKAGQMLGAAGGAVKGGIEGFKLAKGMANPYAKVGVTAGFALLGAAGGAVTGGVIANKVYNAAK